MPEGLDTARNIDRPWIDRVIATATSAEVEADVVDPSGGDAGCVIGLRDAADLDLRQRAPRRPRAMARRPGLRCIPSAPAHAALIASAGAHHTLPGDAPRIASSASPGDSARLSFVDLARVASSSVENGSTDTKQVARWSDFVSLGL